MGIKITVSTAVAKMVSISTKRLDSKVSEYAEAEGLRRRIDFLEGKDMKEDEHVSGEERVTEHGCPSRNE